MHIELDDWFDIEDQHLFFDALAMGHTLVNQLFPTHPPQVGATRCTSTNPDKQVFQTRRLMPWQDTDQHNSPRNSLTG